MFKARNYSLPLGKRTYVMGILNFTPDSFSDGGKYDTPEKALARALEMQEQGADIIDLGANSTRPGAQILSAGEEKERILPALEALEGKLSVPLSVDTFYPSCARLALEHGADIINDISGVFNSEMASLAAEYGAGYIVLHNTGGAGTVSKYENGVVADVRRFFIDCIELAAKCGLSREQLCLDIGLGFSKSREDDIELISKLQWVKFGDVALMVAGSRKRFIGAVSGEQNAEKRDPGTVAANTAAIAGGADIIRVHDVAGAVQGARVADALFRRGE